MLSRISFLICVSDELRKTANKICKCQINSKTILIGIPNNISSQQELIETIEPIKNQKKYRIIFVGSLYPIKGIRYLLESITIFITKKKNYVLEIIGGGRKFRKI